MGVALVAMLVDANDDDDVETNDTTRPSAPCELFVSSYFVVAALAIAVPTPHLSMAGDRTMRLVNLERPQVDGAMTPKGALLTWSTMRYAHRS